MSGPKIVVTGDTTAIGSNARIENGRKRAEDGSIMDDARAWYVFRLVDVSGDPDTTETTRWDEVGMFDDRDDALAAAFEFATA